MNAQEKAMALVEKFEEFAHMDFDLKISAWASAKQCAIIAVSGEVESITILSLLCNFDNKMKPILEEKIKELNEVKTEIEKL